MITRIGENAGRVWKLLNKNGAMNTSKIKTGLKMNEADINLAVGWLAREDKIDIAQAKDSLSISLK